MEWSLLNRFQRWQGPWNAACRWMAGKKSHRCGQECWVRNVAWQFGKYESCAWISAEIQHLNQQTPTKNHSPLFFWFSSYMYFASAPDGCWFFYISSLGARWSKPLQAPRVAGDACIFWAMLMEIHMLAHQCHGNIWVFLRCFLKLPDVGQGSVCLPKCLMSLSDYLKPS